MDCLHALAAMQVLHVSLADTICVAFLPAWLSACQQAGMLNRCCTKLWSICAHCSSQAASKFSPVLCQILGQIGDPANMTATLASMLKAM